MIKVNLLAEAPGQATPRQWITPEQKTPLIGVAMLLVTALGVGGWWYYLRAERAAVDQEMAAAQTTLTQLREAATLVEQATVRKADLTERLALIIRLREAKRGPVSLLETISRSVPDGLWLLEINQTAEFVQIDGRALSLTSVTDFAQRLQNAGLFKRPVEIVTTVAETYEQAAVVRFVVRAEVVVAEAPPADADVVALARRGA